MEHPMIQVRFNVIDKTPRLIDERCEAGEHDMQYTAAMMHGWCKRKFCTWTYDYDGG